MNPRIDQSGIQDRIRRLMAERKERQQDFAAAVQIQASMVSKILKGAEKITRKHLINIEQATGARLQWLESGVEPMYYENKEAPQRSETEHFEGVQLRAYLDKHNIEYTELGRRMEPERTKSTIQGYFKSETLGKTNRAAILKALNATYEDVFGTSIVKPLYSTAAPQGMRPFAFDPNEMATITRIPVKARASFDYEAYFNDQSPNRESKAIRRDLIRPNFDLEKDQNKIALIEIDGDSMEPLLRPGYEVLAYLVNPADWPYLTQVVAVTFRDQFVVKRVADNALLMTGMLTLSSDNPSGGQITIPVNEIHQIWKVDRITDGKV